MCDLQYKLLWTPENPFVNTFNKSNTNLTGAVFDMFKEAFVSCCGNEPSYTPKQIKNQENMMREVKDLTIAMPVSYPSRMLLSDPGTFLRVVDSSGVAFIAKAPSLPDGSLLYHGFTTVWPILLMVIIACGYAALAFWLAEFLAAPEQRQIARPFLTGIFDGYWFAFITATTVGYGDKVAGSRFGKFLTIIWLLVGLAILSSFTAAMTNLFSANQDVMNAEVTMKGRQRIGVLHGSMSRQVVMQFGVKPIECDNMIDLHDMLMNDTVEGIVINQYHCAYLLEAISESLEVEIEYQEPVSTGVVMMIPPQFDSTRQCLQRYLFLRSLDFGNRLLEKLQQRRSSRPDARENAMQVLSDGSQDHFYIMGGVLVGLFLLTWAIDFTVARYSKRGWKR